MQSHSVKLDLPTGPPPSVVLDSIRNKVTITADGRILWNGVTETRQGLAAKLALTRLMNPEPELQLQPDPEARYELVDEVLAVTKRAGVTRMGFVGNERFQRF
jgi:biopolymer transport protein ExbD